MKNIRMDEEAAAGQHAQIFPVPHATKPYWRTELHSIDPHRSTEHLPGDADIVIIGAGLSGVATAYHLSKIAELQPPSIVLLDARNVCEGATGRNGGHIKVLSDNLHRIGKRNGVAAAEEFAEFGQSTIYAIKHTVEEEDLTANLSCDVALMRILTATKPGGPAKTFKNSVYEGHSWTKQCSLVPERFVEQVTCLNQAKAAISVPAASFWPYKFVTQLLAKLVDHDLVNLQTNTPVTAVSSENTVTTSRGSIRAGKVIFATNGHTGGLLAQYVDAIVPYKGTACHIKPKTAVAPHLSQTYNIHYPHFGPNEVDYLNPRPDGGIVVGGAKWTFEHRRSAWYNNWDDSTLLPPAKSAHFDGLMQRNFRGWEHSGAEVDHVWTGVQAATPDQMPHIGEVPGSGGTRYVLAGYNGGGMSLIYLCAKAVAEMVGKDLTFEETGLLRSFKTSSERLASRP
ncbi:FAD dependent oxidoreductase [Teratosphaeria destructans]|uniref:FAD dependent oxidoreductase n=1 Tax=Teratosphaeria destructans TaxID=418781 RepID=A0A9W7VZB3_9PEZI|nr:FAD dependent oxidoreductase [Teratosphaeria destructans]